MFCRFRSAFKHNKPCILREREVLTKKKIILKKICKSWIFFERSSKVILKTILFWIKMSFCQKLFSRMHHIKYINHVIRVFESYIVPSTVVYRMLPRLWEWVRAEGIAQKNAQAGIQAGIGFQVSISWVPGGNLFFSPCPVLLHLRPTAVSLLGKGRSPLLSTRRRAVLSSHRRRRGTCPSLNRYNSSNT